MRCILSFSPLSTPFLVLSLLAILVAALVLLVGHFALDRRRLREFVHSVVHPDAGDPRAAALRLGGAIHGRVRRLPDDPHFLLPVLGPLGAAPGAVVGKGGCCSGMSRLYITALQLLGIDAAQVTLYHSSGHAQHCLVEVDFGDARLIVDPSYGFSYHRADGRPLGLDELRGGCTPHFRSLPGTAETQYPSNSYYDFRYAETRTANWTKSRLRRFAYAVLHRLTGGGIDTLRLHPLLEWPQLLLAAALVMLGAGGVFLAAAIG
jgi:hypothetical protein